MLAVVLAAGRGTRLGPLTTDRSKAMMPVAGQPMIERVLGILAVGGVDQVIVVVHPETPELLRHLGQSSRSAKIQLAYQRHRLGMAHALECAAPQIRAMEVSEFLLASCDNLYPKGHVADLIAYRRAEKLNAALTLMWETRDRVTASAAAVVQNGLVADIVEKPGPKEIPTYPTHDKALSVPSLYALSVGILDYVHRVTPSSRGEREFPDALRLLIGDGGRVGGVLVRDRMTLTEPQDLLDLNHHFLQNQPACATVYTDLPPDTTVLPPVRVETGVDVAPGCHIGPLTYLESGSCVRPNATVCRSVVMRGGSVAASDCVVESVIGPLGQSA